MQHVKYFRKNNKFNIKMEDLDSLNESPPQLSNLILEIFCKTIHECFLAMMLNNNLHLQGTHFSWILENAAGDGTVYNKKFTVISKFLSTQFLFFHNKMQTRHFSPHGHNKYELDPRYFCCFTWVWNNKGSILLLLSIYIFL